MAPILAVLIVIVVIALFVHIHGLAPASAPTALARARAAALALAVVAASTHTLCVGGRKHVATGAGTASDASGAAERGVLLLALELHVQQHLQVLGSESQSVHVKQEQDGLLTTKLV